MSIKVVLILCMSFAIFAKVGCTSAPVESGVNNPYQSPTVEVEHKTECLAQADISNALKTLTSDDYLEVERAQQFLLSTSDSSAGCRAEVISALMKAMDQPNLDITYNENTYFLWRYGAEVLGDLKATEALDLLISHLDMTRPTFSASMSHQPALRGVIKMGPIAIPKLDAVLRGSPDEKLRHSAVYCIATIGGPSAVRSLQEALPSESDKCVNRFIRISLDSFDDSGNIKDRGKWFAGVLCNE